MRFPAALPYIVIAGALVVALVAWLVIDTSLAWLIPVAVLPLGLVYLLIDRMVLKREERRPRAGEG